MSVPDIDIAEIEKDLLMRERLLQLLYAKRRGEPINPGIGAVQLEKLVATTRQLLEFQIWYMREKGWIERTDDGYLAITALGVEQMEANLRARRTA
ncbi:MAG TPA: hypothetical protein VEB21_21085 [Terriglobales bacterium]|nr:hypothetical protein [Terriglobales bacterium]